MSSLRDLSHWRLLAAVALSPLAALYGLFLLARGVRRGARRLAGARHALATVLVCQNGHPNATTGRWECARCKATYLGWIGRCSVCGAGAGWTPCGICGAGIPFPWAGR